MPQKLCSQARTLAGAFNQAGDIGNDKAALIWHFANRYDSEIAAEAW